MSEVDQKAEKERLNRQYQKVFSQLCKDLTPIITRFPSFEDAPKHTKLNIQILVKAVLRQIPPEKIDTQVITEKNKQFNLANTTKLFQSSLKGYNAAQTSNANRVLNNFIEYVTRELAWKSKTKSTDSIALPKNIPVIKEKQMFNASFSKYYHQAISFGLSQICKLNDKELVGLLCLSILFDSKRLDIKFLESISNATKNQLVMLSPKDIHIEIIHSKMPKQSFKPHLSTLSIWLEKLKRNDEEVRTPTSIRESTSTFCKKFLSEYPGLKMPLEMPTNLNQILEVAESEYFLHRPAFFHAAMTMNKHLQPTSLPLETKCRILTGQAVKREKDSSDDSTSFDDTFFSQTHAERRSKHQLSNQLVEGDDLHTGKPLSWQLATIKNTLKKIAPLSKKEAIKFLNQILQEDSPDLSLISYWLISWLESLYSNTDNHEINHFRSRNPKYSSIQRYFRPVSVQVLSIFDNIDVLQLEEDEWIEYLQECIERSNDNNICSYLKRFVRFLNHRFQLSNLPLHDLNGNDGFYSANANLISPVEVNQILDMLLQSNKHNAVITPDNRLQACVLILGYFCGLRRNEALGIRVTDIYGHADSPFLFLRPHKKRTLKNTYSRRRLHLVDLVPRPYLKVLMEQHKFRISTGGNYLLSFDENLMGDETLLIDPVQNYCRQITGDQTFVFHGLRHSFANYFLLRIMQVAQPNLIRWFGHNNKNKLIESSTLKEIIDFYSIDNSKALIKKYFPKENQTLPKSTLLQLAEILGHKVPKTTCRSYLHLIDEFETTFQEKPDDQLFELLIDKYWKDFFEMPYQRTRLKRKLLSSDNEFDADLMAEQLYDKLFGINTIRKIEGYPRPSFSSKFKRQYSDQSTDFKFIWKNLDKIYPIYELLFVKNHNSSEIAEYFGFPKQWIEQIRNNALEISKIKTSKGKPRFQHPFLMRRSNNLRKRLISILQKTSKTTIDMKKIQDGIALYLRSSQQKNAHRTMLKNASELGKYFYLFKILKLPLKNMELRIYPSADYKKTSLEIEQYWQTVFKEISGSNTNIEVRIFSPISVTEEFGYVELSPVFDKDNERFLLDHYQYALFIFALIILI